VPGNGKTISIKALINSLASRPEPVPSLYVKSFDSCNGPKWSIRSIFTQARTMAPCLLIFEDLDSLVEKKTRSYFLNEVDGLESNDGILMIGSTNHLDQLDSAISKRPSRFDRKYHFKVPSEEERVAYCKYWRQKLVDSDLVEFPEALCPILARMTEGFSFAYLKELFIIALLTIARGAVDDLENSDSGSSSDGVIVDHEQAAIATDKKGTEKPSPKKKKAIPEVDVPASLQDNLLLRAVRIQCKLLLDEMDNTDEDETPFGKKNTGEGSRAGAILAAAAAARRTGAELGRSLAG
jgi:transitional endoplasmic reticulum ATPase